MDGPSLPKTTDVLVIGGGIIGISIALEVRRRFPDQRVLLIEKEPEPGLHASGRNSGVLHAGFYYHADSLKAQLTRDGNARLRQYCLERGIALNACGKVVVARTDADLEAFPELLRRAEANGVELSVLSLEELRQIEPRARTVERALYSPTTATVDPRDVMASLVADARSAGIQICSATRYVGRGGRRVRTSRGAVESAIVINAAGLYADRVARDFGFAQDHAIVPFRGAYLYSSDEQLDLRTNVYPVPDLRQPFLGVHLTVTVDGKTKIGPTATPGFWREHYKGFRNFALGECLEVLRREFGLWAKNHDGFRALARRELGKLRGKHLLKEAGHLVAGLGPRRSWYWGDTGVRAQLVNVREHRLEMDFRFEGDDRSMHVLNAVSPAFTCALPFAGVVLDALERARGPASAGSRPSS